MRFSTVATLFILYFAVLAFLHVRSVGPFRPEVGERMILTAGSRRISVALAKTDSERTVGLGGRNSLGSDEGMLFVFPKAGRHGICVKDMRFPIDIIWLNKCFAVVDMKENVIPDSFPAVFFPKEINAFVLEVNAGWIEKARVHFEEKFLPTPDSC